MKIIPASDPYLNSDTTRAAIAQMALVEGAHNINLHTHDRAQLIHALTGNLIVEVEDKAFLITSEYALWIPAQTPHAIIASNSVQYCSVFVDQSVAIQIANQVMPIYMKPLLQQLAISAAEFNRLIESDSPESRIISVLVDQLYNIEQTEMVLTIPKDHRLQRIISRLIQQPSLNDDINLISHHANVSIRTIERIFKKETGFSFKQWQQRVMLFKAMELLRSGRTVKQLALEFGYQTSSAFIAMFKRIHHQTPGEYIRAQQKQ